METDLLSNQLIFCIFIFTAAAAVVVLGLSTIPTVTTPTLPLAKEGLSKIGHFLFETIIQLIAHW